MIIITTFQEAYVLNYIPEFLILEIKFRTQFNIIPSIWSYKCHEFNYK